VNTPEGRVEFWHQTVEVDLPLVTYDTLTRNLDNGVETRSRDVLAFRTIDAVGESLRDAGFDLVDVYGDWLRRPVNSSTPELIVIATRQ